MYRVSYRTHFKVRKEHIPAAAKLAKELFELWEDNVDTEDMILTFDEQNGWFTFDTKGDCQCPRWLTDDTPMMLRDLGRHCARGSMVYHTKGGESYNFPVGPSVLSQQQTLEMEQVLTAMDALKAVMPLVPDDSATALKQALDVLDNLRK